MFAARTLRTTYDDVLAPTGLNLSQASSLAYVAEFGPISQTELAQSMGIGRAATGTVVDGLEGLGYVERQPDPQDRRVWLVAVTAGGKEVAAEVMTLDEAFRTDLRRGISKAERTELADLLLRLQENMAHPTNR